MPLIRTLNASGYLYVRCSVPVASDTLKVGKMTGAVELLAVITVFAVGQLTCVVQLLAVITVFAVLSP